MRFLLTAFFSAVLPAAAFEKTVLPILKESCLKCHGGKKVKGDVDFSEILTVEDADADFDHARNRVTMRRGLRVLTMGITMGCSTL